MDLEVYQKLLENAVFVSKYIVGDKNIDVEVIYDEAQKEQKGEGDMLRQRVASVPSFAKATEGKGGVAKELIFHQMLPCALGLPHLIAEAHSVRFGGQKECLILLERAMLNCNKMAVYLEETRDIAEAGVSCEKFDELIKKYLHIRQKILNLQRSWKKYMDMK